MSHSIAFIANVRVLGFDHQLQEIHSALGKEVTAQWRAGLVRDPLGKAHRDGSQNIKVVF